MIQRLNFWLGRNSNRLVSGRPALLAIALILWGAYGSYAQQSQLTGTVKSPSQEPLPGVSVTQKGVESGATTDDQGRFTLEISGTDAILVFTHIGYVEQELSVGGRQFIDVTLQESVSDLSEVVVVGYGEREKGELTGAVASVSGKAIEESAQPNITQALQGRVPGLIVNNRGGIPGSDDASILIRGKSTLGDNAPLIIIDGIPRESFSHLSPNDIETISVLKDAAAAIYGARAANGVILIKTKRGSSGSSDIKLLSEYALSGFTRLPKYMNSYQYASWENEIANRYGRVPQWTDEDLEKYRTGESPLTHPNTDFYHEVFRQWAPQLHENISAAGGTEQIRYYISGDLLDQGGLYRSGDLKYNQYQLRSNIDAQMTNNLTVGFDLMGRLEKQHSTSRSVNSLVPFIANWAYPYNVGYYPNGLPGVGGPEGQNPVIISSDKAGWVEQYNKVFQSKLTFELKLGWITQGLALHGYGAFDFDIKNNEVFHNTWDVYNYNPATGDYDVQQGQNQDVGATRTLQKQADQNQRQLYHLRFNYDRSFNNHRFNGFVAYEQEVMEWETLSAYRRDLISGKKVELFTGGPALRDNNGLSSESGRVNYFGSLSYDYMRKYLVDITFRRDGSFNFPQGKRFGSFPGISAGWNVSKESFMSSTNSWLSNLKIRASWAKMGNDRINAFQYLTQYELNTYYIYGQSPRRENGFSITNTSNPDITWEISKNKNIGVEFGLWGNALSGSIDYFQANRRQILIKRSASVPDYTALELPMENLGKVDNSGIEMVLNYQGAAGNINYSLGGNFTYNRNKVVFMDEPLNVNPYRAQEGHPMDSWVIYKTAGLYHSQEQIDNSPHLQGTKPGDIRYVDVNEDGAITGDDQVRMYTSPIPEIQFGFHLGANYKGFELSALFNGQARATTLLMFFEGGNKPEYLFDERWTEQTPDARYPRAYERNDVYNTKASDYWLYDASFVRLNNLSLAYNISSEWFTKAKVKGLKVYVRGTNLVTFGMIEGQFDPEINTSNGGYYPQQKTVTAGINLIF